MKKILAALLVITAFSCSSDSDSESAKLVSKITTTSATNGFNLVYTFTYDEKNRVSSISKIGDSEGAYTYHYDKNGNADRISVTLDNETKDIVSTYDGKILTSFTYNNVTTPITFDSKTNTYLIQGITIKLNKSGDFDAINNSEFSYDGQKKGAFRNNKSNFQLLSSFFDGIFTFVGAKESLKSIVSSTDGTETYNFTSTYSKDGYLEKEIVTGVGVSTTSFIAEFEY